jgi:hypothetical protein
MEKSITNNYCKGGKFLLATVHAVRVSISVWNPYVLGATNNNVSGNLWEDYLRQKELPEISVLQ